MSKKMSILDEANRLALTLSMNCTLALAKNGMLLREQSDHCAAAMEALARQLEETSDAEEPPSRLASELHSVAAILRQTEAPDDWPGLSPSPRT